MSEKSKTKHWTFRGETKAVAFRLPVETIAKIEAIAKKQNVAKTQVLIEAIDVKGEAASK